MLLMVYIVTPIVAFTTSGVHCVRLLYVLLLVYTLAPVIAELLV